MILKLNKELYPKKSILKTIKGYEKIADFKLKEEKKYFLISGKIEKENEDLIKNEFLNFVLGVIKQ